jgi:hypothetical protein
MKTFPSLLAPLKINTSPSPQPSKGPIPLPTGAQIKARFEAASAASADIARQLTKPIEDHHQAVGGFLKLTEAAITDLRYNHYLHDGEVGRALVKLGKAINELRQVLDRRRTRHLGGRPGGDAYFGAELGALHKLNYEVDTQLKVHRDRLQIAREVDQECPLTNPAARRARRVELAQAKKKPLSDNIRQEIDQMVAKVVAASRRQPQLMPGKQPLALPVSAELPPTDPHAELRAALLEDPDRPQATFVSLCRVHPITVRRCRRELEEAGAIPYLEHRHAA